MRRLQVSEVEQMKVGKLIQKRWLVRLQQINMAIDAAVEPLRYHLGEPILEANEIAFFPALYTYAKGDVRRFRMYLSSGRGLTGEEGIMFAQVLGGALTDVCPKGRKPSMKLRDAALGARVYYSTWQEENTAAGLLNQGLRGDMQTEAARFIIEDLQPEHCVGVRVETVVDLMNRSSTRRNGRSPVKEDSPN